MSLIAFFNFLRLWYYRYTIHTALYMLESWERCIFNSILVAIIAMASYTTYLFLPGHLLMWYRFIEYYVSSEGIDSLPLTGATEMDVGAT